MRSHIKSVFFHTAQRQTNKLEKNSFNISGILPSLIYISTQCLGQHGPSSKNKTDATTKTKIVLRSLRFLPPVSGIDIPANCPQYLSREAGKRSHMFLKQQRGCFHVLAVHTRLVKAEEEWKGGKRSHGCFHLFPGTLQKQLHSYVLVILQVLLGLPTFSQATSG